jgi:hypothetical protein
MTRTHLGLVLPPAAVAAGAVALTTPAVTDQDTCISGFVWREASPSDHVCVKAGWRTRSTCRIRKQSERIQQCCLIEALRLTASRPPWRRRCAGT